MSKSIKIRAIGNPGDWYPGDWYPGDWKSRLHKQSPPTRTEERKFNPLSSGFVCVDAVSTAENLQEIQPVEAGFVCVDAVSTAGELDIKRSKSGRWEIAIIGIPAIGNRRESPENSTRFRRVLSV